VSQRGGEGPDERKNIYLYFGGAFLKRNTLVQKKGRKGPGGSQMGGRGRGNRKKKGGGPRAAFFRKENGAGVTLKGGGGDRKGEKAFERGEVFNRN